MADHTYDGDLYAQALKDAQGLVERISQLERSHSAAWARLKGLEYDGTGFSAHDMKRLGVLKTRLRHMTFNEVDEPFRVALTWAIGLIEASSRK